MKFSQAQNNHWSSVSKITLRFCFSYFALFILLLFTALFLEAPLRWFADAVLNWGSDFNMNSTGSGDRTFDYVRFALNIVLAIFTGVLWSVFDRKRASYNTLFYWFQTMLRIFLFFAMLLYGLVKIFKGQFADPSLELLLQPVGEMSPMGLAWTFMGHSMGYNLFIGFAEVLGGVLLLYRKTLTLGSMIIVGVMTNVAVMNFTYDIPVKLFSVHLVLMALLLWLADGRRFVNVFLKNKTAEQVNHVVPITNTSVKKIISFFKKSAIVVLTIVIFIQCFVQFKLTEQLKTKSELYGIWETQLFIKNKDTVAPLITDSYRWRYLIVNYKGKVAVKKMNDSIDRYLFDENKEQKEISIKRFTDSILHQFSYQFIDAEHLQLKGVLDGDSLLIQFQRKRATDFRLLNRKFHWINESTYNY